MFISGKERPLFDFLVKLVPSLAYVINIYTTQTVTDILSKQVSACGSQITTINNKFNNYVMKSEHDALKLKFDSLEERLTSIMINLTLIKYTFNVPNSNSITYQFEQPDAYEGTLYLTYNETKDNVASEKEIKINISFNANKTPTYKYQCEPTKIWLSNHEFPLNSSNFIVNETANFILINTSFFKSNGILTEDNTKNEIHSLF